MIPESNIGINNPYYFDMDGQIKQTSITSPLLEPQPIPICLKDGKITHLFLAYNPWKTTESNQSKIYQFCIICKNKRFEQAIFSQIDFKLIQNRIRKEKGEYLACCQDKECFDNLINFIFQVNENKLRTIIHFNPDLPPNMLFQDLQLNQRYTQTKNANSIND